MNGSRIPIVKRMLAPNAAVLSGKCWTHSLDGEFNSTAAVPTTLQAMAETCIDGDGDGDGFTVMAVMMYLLGFIVSHAEETIAITKPKEFE